MKLNKKNRVEVLLVGSDEFFLLFDNDDRSHRFVKDLKSIFPSLYLFCPKVVIIEYDHFKDIVNYYLMRIRANKYYYRLKVYCCLKEPNEITIEHLKLLRTRAIVTHDLVEKRQRLY